MVVQFKKKYNITDLGKMKKHLGMWYDWKKNENNEPVWQKTGSYYAEWSLNQNYELVLSYDAPCIDKNCTARFYRHDVLWNEVK